MEVVCSEKMKSAEGELTKTFLCEMEEDFLLVVDCDFGNFPLMKVDSWACCCDCWLLDHALVLHAAEDKTLSLKVRPMTAYDYDVTIRTRCRVTSSLTGWQ